MKKKTKIFIGTIYLSVFLITMLSVLLVISGIKSFNSDKPDIDYTLDDVFSDISPVMKTQTDSIIRPYLSDSVKIGKYFYDYKANKEDQEKSIIYYKNTYIQNSGVDYVSNEDFDVVSILDGEVIGIEENEIYGKVVTIKHNDNLKTIYSNMNDVTINVGYKVSQGEIIGTSMESRIDNDKKSTLHFEVYYKNNVIDPEKLYTLSVSELE